MEDDEDSLEPLAAADIGDAVEVLPRFFAISTAGVADFLPDSATVTFSWFPSIGSKHGTIGFGLKLTP